MIASYHPHANELTGEHVAVGKPSRIQDGILVRLHAVPRTKHEGLSVVLGPCTYSRQVNGCVHLLGPDVDSFWRRFCDRILCNVISSHAPGLKPPDTLRIKSKDTKFFRYNEVSHTYTSVHESAVDASAYGFAVIMTRGPWFHASKQGVTCSWNLLEFVMI
jgi:hypothetical protein